jgi:hypothetical protein
MIIPLTTELARTLGAEFFEGKVQKEYIARCSGEFPEYLSSLCGPTREPLMMSFFPL